MLCSWLRCHSTDCSTCLLKLFHVHLAVAVQIKHLKGDFKIPLGSYMKNPTKHKNQLTKIKKLNKKRAQVLNDFIQKQFCQILSILVKKCSSKEPLTISFMVLFLPKILTRSCKEEVFLEHLFYLQVEKAGKQDAIWYF